MEPVAERIREREVHSFRIIRKSAKICLDKGLSDPVDSLHLFRASLILMAFSFEGYLNHVGKKLFNSWDDLERISWNSKLSLITEKLELSIEKGNRPWQTIIKLFDHRNTLAHPKLENLSCTDTIPAQDFIKGLTNIMDDLLETEWENYPTEKNSQRLYEDSEQAMEIINNAGKFKFKEKFDDNSFYSEGYQITSKTLGKQS